MTVPVPVPPMVAPPPVATDSVPLVTVSVVVSAAPVSTSATDTPEIAVGVSSTTLCAPGTVFTGASLIPVTLMCKIADAVWLFRSLST